MPQLVSGLRHEIGEKRGEGQAVRAGWYVDKMDP